MPPYAVLGATGTTGKLILDQLLQSPNNIINCYVRSKKKLEKQVPNISSNSQVRIFEGAIEDVTLITNCIKDTQAVFSVVAAMTNAPGTSVALDTAHVLVAALCEIRTTNPDAKLPRIVVLSAAPTREELVKSTPAPVVGILHRALGYIYEDLIKMQNYYRLHSGWLDYTIVQPGGLNDAEPPSGYKLSFTWTTKPGTWLAYADLAVGMIEAAQESDQFHNKEITILPVKDGVPMQKGIGMLLIQGLVYWYLPVLYSLGF